MGDSGESEVGGDSVVNGDEEEIVISPKSARKMAKKKAKLERRAKREGSADRSVGTKRCDVCGEDNKNLLIRCQVDESRQWKMVCGRCWHKVSGGQVDGDVNHPFYRYGGLWKNRLKRHVNVQKTARKMGKKM